MATTTDRLPEPYRAADADIDFGIDEFAADVAGSLSPYGPEAQFPLPVEQLRYQHPRPEDRPHLADGR